MTRSPQPRRLAAVLAAVLAAACATGPEEIDVRVQNRSSIDFAAVDVHFPDVEVAYGVLAAGSTSPYRAVAGAYRYAGVTVRTATGDTLRLVPIDYVGEERLRSGRYTYALDVLDGALTLELVR